MVTQRSHKPSYVGSIPTRRYSGAPVMLTTGKGRGGKVAQWLERDGANDKVGGSNPSFSTNSILHLLTLYLNSEGWVRHRTDVYIPAICVCYSWI